LVIHDLINSYFLTGGINAERLQIKTDRSAVPDIWKGKALIPQRIASSWVRKNLGFRRRPP